MPETEAAGAEGSGETTTPKIPAGYIPESEVAGLKAKTGELLGKLARANERLKAIPEDFDPEAWSKLRETAEKGKSAEERLTKQLEAEKSKAASLEAAFQTATIIGEATRAIGGNGDAELLMPHVLAVAQVVQEDGVFVTRIRDKHNGYRYGTSGEPMTISEFVNTELKTRFPRAFDGLNVNGSGAKSGQAGTRGAKSLTRTAFDALSPSEKAEFVRGGGIPLD